MLITPKSAIRLILMTFRPNTDGYATQKFSVGYAVQSFDATVSTKKFQVFSDQSTPTYGAEPQLDVNWYQNDVGPFDTHVYAQAVHFVNTDSDMPEATRVHLEPTINLPWSNDCVIWPCWRMVIPRRLNRGCSICTCHTATRATFRTTTPLYCSLTIVVCSVTVLTVVWTVSPQRTS